MARLRASSATAASTNGVAGSVSLYGMGRDLAAPISRAPPTASRRPSGSGRSAGSFARALRRSLHPLLRRSIRGHTEALSDERVRLVPSSFFTTGLEAITSAPLRNQPRKAGSMAFPRGIAGPERPPAEVGMECTSQPPQMPRQASKKGGRSGHGLRFRRDTARSEAVVQP